MLKLIVVTLLVLVAYAAARCHDCTETQCCIMGMGGFREEACGPRGDIGDDCSELSPIDGKYPLRCPCLPGLECKGTGLMGQMNKKCRRPETTTSEASITERPTPETPSPPSSP